MYINNLYSNIVFNIIYNNKPNTSIALSTNSAPPIPPPNNPGNSGDALTNKYWKMLAFKECLILSTQPVQVVMRVQQNSLKEGSVFSVSDAFRYINGNCTTKGELAQRLWAGTQWALIKEGVKYATYKTPILAKTPGLFATTFSTPYTRSLPNSVQHAVNSVGAAGLASLADTILGGGLDRVAAYYALRQGENVNASFMQEMRSHGSLWNQFLFLNKGFTPTFFKTFLNLTAIYSVRGPIEAQLYTYKKLQEGDSVPGYIDATAAIATGSVAGLISAPFDAIKAMAQSPGSKNTPLFETLEANVKRHGLAGATTGVRLKIVQAILGWSAVSYVLDTKKTVPEEGRSLRLFK